MPDDAPYFFKIAKNYSEGLGFTFDGINKTNGFQPLWQYILIPIYFLYSGSPEVMFRLFLLLQVVFISSACIFVNLFLREIFDGYARLLSFISFIMVVYIQSINGMESALLILLLSYLIYYSWKSKIFIENNPKKELIFGVLLGFVMLSRLDTVFLGFTISLFGIIYMIFEKKGKKEHIVRLICIIGGATLIVMPYLIYNYLEFGKIMPISGELKSTFPQINFFLEVGNFFSKRYLLFALFAIMYFLIKVLFLKNILKSPIKYRFYSIFMLVFSAAIILHFLHIVLFMKWAVFGWHFLPYALFVSLAVSEIFTALISLKIFRRTLKLFWYGFFVLVIVSGIILTNRNERNLNESWQVASYRAAMWTKNNTEESEIFSMIDAGIFGFFSERRTINLDGLVNTLEYQEVLRNKKLNDYFENNDVSYYVNFVFKDYQDAYDKGYKIYRRTFPSQKYNIESDEIQFLEENEVYRSTPTKYWSYEMVFLIWRLQ
ncbi:hypothetical protein ACFL7D_02165 [candidate division KSB1 bacterium]